jgi:2-oxo-4-hydroxy-4-carboxy-5-ureidoimidazoline decarboxylase
MTIPAGMTIEDLNSLERAQFVSAIGWVFEHSPWVAERTWTMRPFADVQALHRAMVDQVERSLPEEQLALLRAHPDLGTRARVSEASSAEQAGAGLDQLTPAEFERLRALNETYRGKFGFPFLFAVKGSTKHDILDALEQRARSSREAEYLVALDQVYRIARFRLEATVS